MLDIDKIYYIMHNDLNKYIKKYKILIAKHALTLDFLQNILNFYLENLLINIFIYIQYL